MSRKQNIVTALVKNQGTLAELVIKRAYQQFALPPAAAWLGSEVPAKPEITVNARGIEWHLFDPRLESTVKWWLIQSYEKGAWQNARLLPVAEKTMAIPKESQAISLRGISLTGIAGEVTVKAVR